MEKKAATQTESSFSSTCRAVSSRVLDLAASIKWQSSAVDNQLGNTSAGSARVNCKPVIGSKFKSAILDLSIDVLTHLLRIRTNALE